jgi:hypothetical protein
MKIGFQKNIKKGDFYGVIKSRKGALACMFLGAA